MKAVTLDVSCLLIRDSAITQHLSSHWTITLTTSVTVILCLSWTLCVERTQDSPFNSEVRLGITIVKGGYEDRHKSFHSFLLLTSYFLDLKAEEVLQKFLQSKEEVSDAILQTDQTLKEKEKETEGKAQLNGLHALKSCGMFRLFLKPGPSSKLKGQSCVSMASIRHGSTMMSAVTMEQVRKRASHAAFTYSFLIAFPVERVRAEATQAAARMQEEMQQENKQLLQQKKSHEKHIKVLTEKMEKVQAQLSKEKRAHLKISLVFKLHQLHLENILKCVCAYVCMNLYMCM